jgi:hypothetical protein
LAATPVTGDLLVDIAWNLGRGVGDAIGVRA